MKIRILIIVVLGALLAAWIARTNARRMKEVEDTRTVATIQENRAKAKDLLLAQCTNEVTGLNRIVSVFVDDSANAVFKWKGKATVEYVNTAGGVDRTNLNFIFDTAFGDLQCIEDPEWVNQLQTEAFHQAMREATNRALGSGR